jgi:hypothetical protein
VVEGRFEELVLDQQAHLGVQLPVEAGECLLQPVLARPQVVLAGVVRAIGEPEAHDVRADGSGDLDALEQVLHGSPPHLATRVAEAAQAIGLVLEQVGVDATDPQAKVLRVPARCSPVAGAVPGDVDRDRRADPGQTVHLGRVLELLLQRARGAGPGEHPEAGAAVAVAPGGRLHAQPKSLLERVLPQLEGHRRFMHLPLHHRSPGSRRH